MAKSVHCEEPFLRKVKANLTPEFSNRLNGLEWGAEYCAMTRAAGE